MKNRITNGSSERSQEPCNCGYPMVIRIRDVAVGKKRKRNGFYTVDRYFDCIICGPHVCRTEVVEIDESDPWKK